MYFDRPTVFAKEDWCVESRQTMTWTEFRLRVLSRVVTADEYPDIVKAAFRNIVDHSSEKEYELAIDTVVRDIRSRRAHVSEVDRRRSQGTRRNIPVMRMARRANGE